MQTSTVLLILAVVFLLITVMGLTAYLAFRQGGWFHPDPKPTSVSKDTMSPSGPVVGASLPPSMIPTHTPPSNPIPFYPSVSSPSPMFHHGAVYQHWPVHHAPPQSQHPFAAPSLPLPGSTLSLTKPQPPQPHSGNWGSSWMAGMSNIHNACLLNGWDFNQYRGVQYAVVYRVGDGQSPISDYTQPLYNPPYCSPSMNFVGIPDQAVVDVFRIVIKPDGSLRGPQRIAMGLHPRSTFVDRNPIPA